METMNQLCLASFAWQIDPEGNLDSWKSRFSDACRLARKRGADWLIFPEFFSFEIVAKLAPEECDFARVMAGFYPEIEKCVRENWAETGLNIVAGSHIAPAGATYANVALIASRVGLRRQTKNKLTTYEREVMNLEPGMTLCKPVGPVSTLICYDCEFPEAARATCEAGAAILAVPSFTETEHGKYRVELSCRARAIENQIFVANSPLHGGLGFEPVITCCGQAAIFAPSISPYPADGILDRTEVGAHDFAIATVDLDELASARSTGDVRNWDDRLSDCWSVSD